MSATQCTTNISIQNVEQNYKMFILRYINANVLRPEISQLKELQIMHAFQEVKNQVQKSRANDMCMYVMAYNTNFGSNLGL